MGRVNWWKGRGEARWFKALLKWIVESEKWLVWQEERKMAHFSRRLGRRGKEVKGFENCTDALCFPAEDGTWLS